MKQVDFAKLDWVRIDPSTLGPMFVTGVETTGVPGLVNAVVLHTATAVYSIETDGVGLEVYRAGRKEVIPQ